LAIHLYRSNRTESLVEALCEVLHERRPEDPFEPFPIVVGSRGMERWLRHEIATRMDVAAGLVFPFPRQALAGAARWLLDGADDPGTAFWDLESMDADAAERWEREALGLRLVGLLRRRVEDRGFASVARYLGEADTPQAGLAVSARELLFAGEVGDVLDRLLHDRPLDALAWAEDPASAPEEHRWLATLLSDLGAANDPSSPARLHRELTRGDLPPTGRCLCVFGLSTMGAGDRRRLAAIARSIDIHLFVLVPTNHWFQQQRTRAEAGAARRTGRTDEERGRIEAQIESDNPVLASLGAPSRDLQLWLEEVEYLGDVVEAVDPAATEHPTLLERLQSWILSSAGIEPDAEPWSLDGSVSLHSTYGPLRQCEVLRDRLLRMFAEDPALEPRDVVVMTPDIETYAPLVEAVFSRAGAARDEGVHLPRIPLSVADLGLRRTNPVAEVLLKGLEVAGDRIVASWVLDFLALEPVRARWDLSDDDLADIGDMVRESRLCWGLDAADRAAVDQPALDQNTVRFALERLALGVLMPDEAPLDVVPDRHGSLMPAVPLDVESPDRVRRVGRLISILRAVAAHRRVLGEPATLGVWRDRLVSLLDELAGSTEETGWLRAEVDRTLDDMARLGESLGELEVDRSAILRWLQGGFEIPRRGDRPITGAVQLCALEPMRSVPFRVVALLGLDDKVFPRGGRSRTWDPMERREPGERDRRETDRHLMLEAVLSARDRLLILWSGHRVQQGEEQAAAVPVEELLETLGRLTALQRGELVNEHPLQPWSAASFQGDSAGFDARMCRAAGRLLEIERGERQSRALGLGAGGAVLLPPEETLADTLELNDLASALLRPQRLLLGDRLGLRVSDDAAPVEDREPLELDTLDAWSLRSRIVGHLMEDPQGWTDEALVDALEVRVAAEGELPLKAGGRAILEDQLEHARELLAHLGDIAGESASGLELEVPLQGGLRLVGRVEHVVERDGELLLQWCTPSKEASERLRMVAWLHLLAAVATGSPVVGARLVGYGSSTRAKCAGGLFLSFAGDAAAARATLEDLAGVWRLARCCPLPLFEKTSTAVAKVLEGLEAEPDIDAVRAELVAGVSTAWSGSGDERGDIQNPWIATLFADYDPVDHLGDEGSDSLVGLARTVWLPVVEGLEAGKAVLAAAWKSEEAV